MTSSTLPPVSGLSAHQRIALSPVFSEMAQMALSVIVLPAQTPEGLVRLVSEASGWRSNPLSLDDIDLDLPEADNPITLEIEYLYRCAANYKISGSHRWTGTFSLLELAILLTALLGDSEGFIPGQLGLANLPLEAGWSLDFTGDDHPWHVLTALEAHAPDPGATEAPEAFLDLARKALQTGYDPIAAISEISSTAVS